MKTLFAFLIGLLLQGMVFAQSSVVQGGPWTYEHVPVYASQGSSRPVLGDSGSARGTTGLGITELGLTEYATGSPPFANAGSGPFYTNFCDYDGPINSANGYHYLCLGPNSNGTGLITYGAVPPAAQQPLAFNINGVAYSFPFSSGGIVGPNTSVLNDLACWNNTSGTLLKDCGAIPTVPVGANPTASIGNTTVNGSATTFMRSDAAPALAAGAALGNIGTGGISPVYLASGAALSNIGTGNVTASYLSSGAALANIGAGNVTNYYLANPYFFAGAQTIALGSSALTQGSGNLLQLSSGAVVAGDCAKFDSSGNTIDAGVTCGGGGGGGASCTAGSNYCVGWFNVVSYGAVNTDSSCSSTTATTTAFNNALAAATSAGGGVVYAPAGTYCITSLNTFGSNIVLKGDGRQATNIISQSTTGNMISINGNFNAVRDLMLTTESVRTAGSAINISGNNNMVVNVSLNADYTTGNGHSWFNGITVNDAANGLTNTWNITLRDIYGVYVSNIDVYLGWAFSITLDDVQFGAPPTLLPLYGISLSHGNTVVVMNSGFAGAKGGMLIDAVAGDTIYAVNLNDVFFDAVTNYPAVQITETVGSSYATSGSVYEVKGVKVWGSMGTTNNGIEVDGAVVGGKQLVSDITFENSMMRSGGSGSAGTGFLVNGAQDVKATSSTFSGFAQGMAVASGTSDVSFVDNSAGAYGNPGPTGYPGGTLPNGTGIVINGSSDYINVQGNRLGGNTTAGLTNASTGANTIICNNPGTTVSYGCTGGAGTIPTGAVNELVAYTSSTTVAGTNTPIVTTLTATGSGNIALNMNANEGLYCAVGQCGTGAQNLIYGSSGGITWLGSPPGSGGGNIVAQNNFEPSSGGFSLGTSGVPWGNAYLTTAAITSSATIAGNKIPSVSGSITSGQCPQFTGTAGVMLPITCGTGTITSVSAGNQLTGGGSSGAVSLGVSTTPSFSSVTTNLIDNTSGVQIVGYTGGSNTLFLGAGGYVTSEGTLLPNGNNTYNIGSASFDWSNIYLQNNPTVISDRRKKKDIEDEPLGLEFINRLEPREFRLIDGKNAEMSHGLIAQEVETALGGKSFAGLVKPTKEADIYELQYEQFISPLIRSVQEIDAKVNIAYILIGLLVVWNGYNSIRLRRLEKRHLD